MNVLDLFSGAGGFSLGLQMAGVKANHYFSEIDKHAIAVYQHNFKYAKYVGSVTDVRGADLPKIDIITFGSPCQDFSLAGKRSGMEGERSSLISEAIRLIHECRPDFFIWENVKGVYSSNEGRDFQAILREFANIGGYRLEWQLLNTKWFLPQNRERVYLVGHLAASKRSFRQVFPLGADTPKPNKRPEQTQIVRAITAGGNSGGMQASMTLVGGIGRTRSNKPYKDKDFVPSLRNGDKDNFRVVSTTQIKPSNKYGCGDPAPPIVNRIRRLTPIECERLQGFPDNWTKFGNYDGEIKEVSDTQRYKMMGNAVTTVVVEAIIRGIYG